ncbi:MAG: methyltransferase [Alphaproteobacteria bacterium]|nr:methyltransferase [Alphaproteobacteria bacterium]
MSRTDHHSVEDRFRPSDYSAALVQKLLDHGDRVRGARVLDVGCGSGVLLAAAGSAGAAHLCGVDIEAGAVEATRTLLAKLGFSAMSDIKHGAMFAPVAGRQFDLVLANLPHFPMNEAAVDGRLSSWSAGGPDGRRLMDRFLCGLAPHLAPQGRALVMHNAFIGLDSTLRIAAQNGLAVSAGETIMVPLPDAKLAVMTPEVLDREIGQSIQRFGGYAFGTVAVLTVTKAKDGAGS